MMRSLLALLTTAALSLGSTGGAHVELAAAADSAAEEDTSASLWVPTGAFDSSSFVRVPRSGDVGPELAEAESLRLQVPRGGRTSAQLAVAAPDGLSDLTVEVSDLAGPRGATLAADQFRVRFPQYIPDQVNGGVVADPLREVDAVDVAPGDNQPVWFTATVPTDAASGRYTGTVEVRSQDGSLGSYSLQLDVPDVTLRPMADRPFVLDLWAHPDAVADYHDVELWSEQHWDALRPYLVDLAEHGQEVVDVAITENPWMVTHEGQWRPQTESDYASTVEWRWDGEEFSFDFATFDRYVTESRQAGIGDTIHAFAMLQFDSRERFVYTDTRTGEQVVEEVGLGDARYREGWGSFLRAFTEHLQEKGWFEDTRLAYDERPIATMEVAFDVIANEAPEWSDKIALAANSLAEADIADFISFNYSFLDQVPDELIQQRLAAGEPTLFYTYFNPQRPNTVTSSPPVSSRVLGWVVEQRDLDGYLRWTYNSWPSNVYEDPRFRYGQGDEYLVYPGPDGPVSSIRWETFRDGQDDAELLNLAKEQLGADADVVTTALGSIDPRSEPTPEFWAQMLRQRANVLDAMAAPAGASITVEASEQEVVAGEAIELDITYTAGSKTVAAMDLDLTPLPESSYTVVEEPSRRYLRPGQQATWRVEVTVPENAGQVAVLAGRFVRGRSTQVLGSFTAVVTTRSAVTVTSPPSVEPASSPDAQAPVTVRAEVSNASGSPVTAWLSVGRLGSWTTPTPTVEIEVPAGGTAAPEIQLNPGGSTGWTTIDATVSAAGVPLQTGRIDIVSGGRHVSDWPWTSETNGWGPVERDTGNGEDVADDGGTLTIEGRTYAKGIGVHANSRIELDLAGQCERFESDYGVDDWVPNTSNGSVVFSVVGDGEQLWQSELVRAADPAQWISLDVTGVQTLELVVNDSGNGNAQDHADWAGAWLRCQG